MTPTRAWCSTAWNSDAAGAGVAYVAQPHRPVRPVQQVGVALVRTQGLDEQPPSVRRDRGELPRAPGRDLGRADRFHRHARAAQGGAATLSGPIRRSGTPNATRTAAPTVTPVAIAMISSIGSTVPVSSRAAATRSSVSHAARRHGRLSQGAAATTTAAADAISRARERGAD